MGVENYLIEGVSCAGKTSVCRELQRRGHHALNTDMDLAYKGDPETGVPVERPVFASEAERVWWVHTHQIWDVAKVRAITADRSVARTFLCGGSRNFHRFVDLFDAVFVLDLDRETLIARLDLRRDEWGSEPAERELVLRLHATQESVPQAGIRIDATQPLERVVDEVLAKCL
ncbi:MAG: AAA family ATPase [Pseudomonadota bacterium]